MPVRLCSIESATTVPNLERGLLVASEEPQLSLRRIRVTLNVSQSLLRDSIEGKLRIAGKIARRAFHMHVHQQAAALETALKLEPENPRVIGAMVRFLRDQPGGSNARLDGLRAKLVERAPNNLAARLEVFQSQIDLRQTAEAQATLEKIPQTL